MSASILKSKGRRGLITIDVNVDASDVFSERDLYVMSYILERTPKDIKEEIGKYFNVTDEYVRLMIYKIIKKLDCANTATTEES